jgi:hypothetical protein
MLKYLITLLLDFLLLKLYKMLELLFIIVIATLLLKIKLIRQFLT